MGGVSFSGIWCSLVFGVHLFVTLYSCFPTNVLAKFVDVICIFFYYTHSP